MPDLPPVVFERSLAHGLETQHMDLLHSASLGTRQIARHEALISADGFPRSIAVIIEGWAGSVDDSGDRRQIFDFLLPGDMCGLEEMTMGLNPMAVRAMTPVTAEYFDIAVVERLLAGHPELVAGFLRHLIFQAAGARVGQSRLRSRSATHRLAGLIHDLSLRLCRGEEVDRCRAVIPLTQFDLADATGLTAIHVNRVLAELRSGRIVSVEKRRLCVEDWPALCLAAQM